jgi:hypothetical protein
MSQITVVSREFWPFPFEYFFKLANVHSLSWKTFIYNSLNLVAKVERLKLLAKLSNQPDYFSHFGVMAL